MSTVRDLITDALLLIGAVASGENPTAAEQADALRSLNRMKDSWSGEGILIPKFIREVFVLTPGQSKYTIGPEGDFDTERPTLIYKAAASDADIVVNELTPFIPGDPLADPPTEDVPATYETIVNSVYEIPVKVMNIQEWAAISSKKMGSTYVQMIYLEGTSPLNTIDVWPVPNVQSALVLYSQKPMSNFISANDVVELPPGYEDAIVYNLALRLAPSYGKQVSAEVAASAQETKANISRNNIRPSLMVSDAFGLTNRKRFNIYSGE